MNEQQQDKDLLEKIHTGQTKMLPKSYFTLKMVLAVLGFLAVLATAVFFCSFAVFYFRTSGYAMLPKFGLRGIRDLFLYFPWLIAAVVLLFLFGLAYVVFKRTTAYKVPALYALAVILVLVVAFGFAVANTPLNLRLLNSARQGRLPLFGRMYMGYGMTRPHDMFFGTVKNLSANTFELQIDTGQVVLVTVDKNTRFPSGEIFTGDTVMVMGVLQENNITAYGIIAIDSDNSAYPQGMMQMHRQMMGEWR